MGLKAVTETAELFRQKNISMTERDKEFVVQLSSVRLFEPALCRLFEADFVTK